MTIGPQCNNAILGFQRPTVKKSDSPGLKTHIGWRSFCTRSQGRRGLQRIKGITSQASCQAGWQDKLLISVWHAPTVNFLENKKFHKNVWFNTYSQAYLVHFCQRFFIVLKKYQKVGENYQKKIK